MLAVYKELLDDKEFLYQFEKEYKKRKAKKRELFWYYVKQKLFGFVLSVMSIVIPIIFDGDATVSILILPLGMYLLVTNEKVMCFKEK